VIPLAEMIAREASVFIMTVFRREVFDAIGGFDETQWRSEDYDFWLRAAQAGFIFRRNPEPLGHYRVRGSSLSHTSGPMIEGLLHSFRKAQWRGIADADARRALDQQIVRFESELLLHRGKHALEQGDFAAAAEAFEALRARGGNRLVGLTAWLVKHVPPAAVLAYRLRGWRPRRLLARHTATASALTPLTRTQA
jgi:hypothetical protein